MNYPVEKITPRELHSCSPAIQLAYLAFCDTLTSAIGEVPGIELTAILTAMGAEFLDSTSDPWLRVFADPHQDAITVALRARRVTASLARRLHMAYPRALRPSPPAPFARVHPDTGSHYILLSFELASMCSPMAELPGVAWWEILAALEEPSTVLDLRLARDFDSAPETCRVLREYLERVIPEVMLAEPVHSEGDTSEARAVISRLLRGGATLIQFELQGLHMRVRAEIANVMQACSLANASKHQMLFDELLLAVGLKGKSRVEAYSGQLVYSLDGAEVTLQVHFIPEGESGEGGLLRLESKESLEPIGPVEGDEEAQSVSPRIEARVAVLRALVNEYCTEMPAKREEW